jgi:hypothetical protein
MPSTFLCWILPTWPIVACARCPRARISAKDPFFGGFAAAAAGAGAAGFAELDGLLAAAPGLVIAPFCVRLIVDEGRSAAGRGVGGVTREALGALVPKSLSALRFVGTVLALSRPEVLGPLAGPPEICASKSEI